MVISVVSGKGGAGKTTLATSIAQVLEAEFYDLDVDAPNAEYFLKPEFNSEKRSLSPYLFSMRSVVMVVAAVLASAVLTP